MLSNCVSTCERKRLGVRAGFHGGPGPGPPPCLHSQNGGPGGGPGPPGLSSTKCRLGGPGPQLDLHFENADKEGSRAWTSMETCPYIPLSQSLCMEYGLEHS